MHVGSGRVIVVFVVRPIDLGEYIATDIPGAHIIGIECAQRVFGVFKIIVFSFHFPADAGVHAGFVDPIVVVVIGVGGACSQQRRAGINVFIPVMVERNRAVIGVAITGAHQTAAS